MSVPAFNPRSGPPGYLYVRVADHIQARVEAGELAPGSRLPSERDLAAGYGTAVGTVRQAIAELRSRGVVVTLPAKGTYVTS
jgi:DNA-binding GntR family transcriptional regulator